MGGYYEVYTSMFEQRGFTYANVRKASYTGSVNDAYFSDSHHDISVFKVWTIGGIFLHMFSDALLFDMVLNTAYKDGVDSLQDLINRDMRLGIIG